MCYLYIKIPHTVLMLLLSLIHNSLVFLRAPHCNWMANVTCYCFLMLLLCRSNMFIWKWNLFGRRRGEKYLMVIGLLRSNMLNCWCLDGLVAPTRQLRSWNIIAINSTKWTNEEFNDICHMWVCDISHIDEQIKLHWNWNLDFGNN